MSGVELPLRLVLSPGAARAPVAWALPGDGPAAWLEALGALAEALGVSAGAFDLWIVPEVGLLARAGVAARHAAPGAPHACHGVSQAYGLLGERLLVPADGALSPDVTGAELDLALAPGLHLLHPSVGLVRLAPEARLDVRDLLARPAEVEGAWRSLEPPTAPLRLTVIDVAAPPSLAEWIKQGAAGVAEAPPSEAPPAPDEATQGGAGAWISEQAARFVQWAAGAPPEQKDEAKPPEQPPPGQQPRPAQEQPRPSQGGGLFDRLLRWSEQTLADVKDARQRELDRLLHLLDTDPDEGLRFALPLAGDASGGPPAPPGAKLPPRKVDYGAGGARRGASADPWEIDLERHRRLVARYRELASRELRLGRYRRAAYVFAELLGDHAAAASALEQGRHFREAAAVYRDRLDQPLVAARCLERGGLLVEAATLYEAEGRWVEAGDVWSRLERADDARRAYRRAVALRLEQDDPLSAARLLETKLDAADEALEVLAGTWPDHAQAGLCLEDRLGLLARGARHDAARGVLDRLRQDPRRDGRELVLARALGSIAARYPEASVQARARDLARVVSGERLSRRPGPGPEEAEALLQVISRMDPTDRLLGRDVGRMSAQLRREVARARVTRPVLRGEGWTARVVREVHMIGSSPWRAVELEDGESIWAVRGVPAHPLFVQRQGWADVRPQVAMWPSFTGDRVLLAPPATAAGEVAIVVAGRRPLPRRRLLPAPAGDTACEVGAPAWHDERRAVHALARNAQGLTWSLHEGGPDEPGLVLACHDAHDRLLGTCAVMGPRSDDEEEPRPSAPPPLLRAAGGPWVVATAGQQLVTFHGTEPMVHTRLDRAAHDLAVMGQAPPRAVAVSFDEGGRVYFSATQEQRRFGEGLPAARIAFTPDGLLVAVTKDEGRVYLVLEGTVQHQATFAGPGKDVLCVRPMGRPRSVVVVTTDGTVRELELTRSS